MGNHKHQTLLTEEIFKKGILILRKAYPGDFALNHIDHDFVKVWYHELKHIPDAVFVRAVKKHASTKDKFPCLSDLLQAEPVRNYYQLCEERSKPELETPDPQGKKKVQELLSYLTNKMSEPKPEAPESYEDTAEINFDEEYESLDGTDFKSR